MDIEIGTPMKVKVHTEEPDLFGQIGVIVDMEEETFVELRFPATDENSLIDWADVEPVERQLPYTAVVGGELVTVHGKLGSLGTGYMVNGLVYRTTGSYWAVLAVLDVDPMVSYDQDGGYGYKAEVDRLFGKYYTRRMK